MTQPTLGNDDNSSRNWDNFEVAWLSGEVSTSDVFKRRAEDPAFDSWFKARLQARKGADWPVSSVNPGWTDNPSG